MHHKHGRLPQQATPAVKMNMAQLSGRLIRAEYIELHQEQSREWADSVVQARWTTEKVKEHLTETIAVKDEQKEETKRIVSAHKTIKKA